MERQQGEFDDSLASTHEGEGPPLVFLHGLGASREQAQGIVAAVDGAERITIDAPAHGGSATSTVALNFGAFARAVVELLDDLEIGRATVGGISMGAGISLRLARDFPERVSELVLVRPAWTDRPARPHLDLVAEIGEWITSHGVERARELLTADERDQLLVECEPLAASSVADTIAAALPNATSLLAPPRYLEPEAHQEFLTRALNSFISASRRRAVRTTGD